MIALLLPPFLASLTPILGFGVPSGPDVAILGGLVFCLLLVPILRAVGVGKRNYTLVLKEWRAAETPDAEGYFVKIVGRREGIIPWLLSVLWAAPPTSMRLSKDRIEFEVSTLSESQKVMIPIRKVCSTHYGYIRPWQAALGIFFLMFALVAVLSTVTNVGYNGGTSIGGLFLAFCVGAGAGLLYFFLNRKVIIGFVDDSGSPFGGYGIKFKRSVIENQEISEAQARYVCELIEALIERKVEPV